MNKGMPLTYRIYRGVWSALHATLVGLLVLLGAAWFVSDHAGERLIAGWWSALQKVQYVIAHAIPFPWGGQ